MSSNPASVAKLQQAVHAWADACLTDHDGLGDAAQVLGMVEEFGEYVDSRSAGDRQDAMCDVGIYLLHYCGKRGIVLDFQYEPHAAHLYGTLASAIGRLARCHLKRAQRIRGYDSEEKFVADTSSVANEIANMLDATLISFCEKTFCEAVTETFAEIVEHRDWKKFPKNGISE